MLAATSSVPSGSGASATNSAPLCVLSVSMTARYCGCSPPDTTALRRRVSRCAISTASAVAVEPSYIEALATSMPVSSATCVWNSNRACSVPWLISGW